MKKNRIKKLKRVKKVKIRPKNCENGSTGKTLNRLSTCRLLKMAPQENKKRPISRTQKTVKTTH